MSIIGTIHEDVTTDVVGNIGAWQWMVTFVSTTLMITAMFNQYEDIFLLQPTDVTCIPAEQLEVVNSSLCYFTYKSNSTLQSKCDNWHVKLMWLIWIKKSWLVFCDHKKKLLSTAIISRFGIIFGCVIYGLISDSFGRKTAIAVDVFAELGLGMLITFCDSEGWFRLLVFLKSVFGSANSYMAVILICEIASNKWRSCLCMIVMSPRLLAAVCMVPLANNAPNSETYSFIACIFGVICIILLRWVPESPHWLLYNRKIIRAEKLLMKAANKNGINLCSDFKIRPVNYRAYQCLDETTNCLGVLTTHNIRVTFLVTSLFWTLYNFIWSSLYVRVYSEQDMNVLLKVIIFVGVFGCLTIISLRKFTLRRLLFIHVISTGAFTAGFYYFYQTNIRILVSSAALASGVMVQALIINITARLFAINIRATIFGCCEATGQLGAIISYLLFLFRPMSNVTFLAVEIGVALILTGLCLLFPDVDDRELPDVMEDMDYFCELSKPLRWATQKTSSPSREEVEMRVYSFGSAGRSESTPNNSKDRIPAQRIGFIRAWRRLTNYIQW